MANSTNFNWQLPDDTDLVKDGAAAMRTLGNAIDTSLVDLKGGTTGQVLAKASGTDMDFTWSNDAGISPTIVDAKGDLISATAADTPARLAVGANGTVLTADSAEATGLKWASASTPSLSLIASGSLSGASLTLSSLSSYDYLVILFNGVWQSSGGIPYARINDNSTSNYWYNGFAVRGGSSYTAQGAGFDKISTGCYIGSGNNANHIAYTLSNAKSAAFTSFTSVYTLQESGGSREGGTNMSGIYAVNEAVSSFKFYSGGGTFSGGTYRIYGA